MTSTEFILLALVVVAAVTAGYFIGRWASEREQGQRSARPSPLPAPGEAGAEPGLPDVPAPRHRGAPPPASAGGDGPHGEEVPVPRHRRSPPPASAGDEAASAAPNTEGQGGGKQARRGPPPPAAAGLSSAGAAPKRDR